MSTGTRYVHYATYYTIHITLTLCITISWSREGAVFYVLGHLATSSLLPCLGPTDSHCPLLGDRGPLPPKWHPLSQDPHTSFPHSPEQVSSFKVKIICFIVIQLGLVTIPCSFLGYCIVTGVTYFCIARSSAARPGRDLTLPAQLSAPIWLHTLPAYIQAGSHASYRFFKAARKNVFPESRQENF